MILAYILVGMFLLSIPGDTESSPIPLPMEVFHNGFVRYGFHFDDEQLRRYLKPEYTLPTYTVGTLTCYTDGYASTRLLDGFQGIWETLTARGLLAINHNMALIAQEICDNKWETLNGDIPRESSPDWDR